MCSLQAFSGLFSNAFPCLTTHLVTPNAESLVNRKDNDPARATPSPLTVLRPPNVAALSRKCHRSTNRLCSYERKPTI